MKPVLHDTPDGNEAFLIHELAKHYVRQFDEKARALGLTRTQWLLIRTLRRNPGIRQSELAEILEIAPMSLVHLLDRMEKKKWCRRVPDPGDKRAKKVYLDTEVEPYTARMRSLAVQLRMSALKGFSRAEHGVLVALLERMKHNLVAKSRKQKKS